MIKKRTPDLIDVRNLHKTVGFKTKQVALTVKILDVEISDGLNMTIVGHTGKIINL